MNNVLRFRALSLVAVVLLSLSTLALAQGTYTQIDVPGSVYTVCTGIDSAGDVVGYSTIADGQPVNGFLLSGGTFTTITYQNGQPAVLTGINDVGQIVGWGGKPITGFIYDLQTQTFLTVHYPDHSTEAKAINNAGTVVGQYVQQPDFRWESFEFVGSTYTNIEAPKAVETYATGVTASSTVVGYAIIKNVGTYFNFSYSQGVFQRLILASVPDPLVYGISSSGKALVGIYDPSPETSAGFVYQNHTLTTLQFPGAILTNPYGINDAGEVVGTFDDVNDNVHGFTWTPPADAGKK